MIVARNKKDILMIHGGNLGEEVRGILTALKADEQICNLEEKEIATIEEIAEALERRQK